MKYVKIILRISIAVILIQTLAYKFTAHPDSVYIFTQVGLEPYGRIGIGVLELIAGVLILITRTSWCGALMTIGIISGAIFMHLTILGAEVRGDGGMLFGMAVLVFILASISLWFSRFDVPFVKNLFQTELP
ncbi:MAG: DoxX family protein [Flavobacteriales bacterium]|nr:DoxX family protein [Flavobacteriales bacterium]